MEKNMIDVMLVVTLTIFQKEVFISETSHNVVLSTSTTHLQNGNKHNASCVQQIYGCRVIRVEGINVPR